MQLAPALGIAKQEVVAFVGAGGKTTAMFRIARELHTAAAGVVVTTTTKIFAPSDGPPLRVVTGTERVEVLAEASRAIDARAIPVVGRSVTREGKLDGVPETWVADLAALPRRPHVLVEADGARHLPITAPRDYEPVIPPSTTLVVVVVGLDALGGRIRDVGHHPELIADLTGLTLDDTLDAAAIARVLLGPRGNVKGAPPSARIVGVVNKADTPERADAARTIAAELLRAGAGLAIVAALRSDAPVVEVLAR